MNEGIPVWTRPQDVVRLEPLNDNQETAKALFARIEGNTKHLERTFLSDDAVLALCQDTHECLVKLKELGVSYLTI